MRELIGIVTALGERGVQLRSLTEALDTATPGGRLLFHIMGPIAEFERDLIRQRTMAVWPRLGPAADPTIMTPHKIAVARQMYDAKGADGRSQHTVAEIAAVVGVSRATIYQHLNQ